MHITATEVVNTQWSAPLNECVCVCVWVCARVLWWPKPPNQVGLVLLWTQKADHLHDAGCYLLDPPLTVYLACPRADLLPPLAAAIT